MEWGIETMALFWSLNPLQRAANRALLVCALLSPHASAHDAPTEEAMRQFLLKHPEVIVEALSRYQAEQEKAALAAQIAALPAPFNAGLFRRIAPEEGPDYAGIAKAAEGEAVSQRLH